MTADEQCRLFLAFAKVLFVNGQATERTVGAAERLARALGLRASIIPRWVSVLADWAWSLPVALAAVAIALR
jgi:hypothetical protein